MEIVCLWRLSEGLLPYSFCRLQWRVKGTGSGVHGGGSQVTLEPKEEFTSLMFEWREVISLGSDRGGFSLQTSCGVFFCCFVLFWLKDHRSTSGSTEEGILQSHLRTDPGLAPARDCVVQMPSNVSWHHPQGNSCHQWHCQPAAAWGYMDPSLCCLRALTLQASPSTIQQLSWLHHPVGGVLFLDIPGTGNLTTSKHLLTADSNFKIISTEKSASESWQLLYLTQASPAYSKPSLCSRIQSTIRITQAGSTLTLITYFPGKRRRKYSPCSFVL